MLSIVPAEGSLVSLVGPLAPHLAIGPMNRLLERHDPGRAVGKAV